MAPTPAAPARGAPRAASLGTLFLTVFLDLLGFGLVLPFLPGLARDLGASDFVATLPGAAYSLMQFLFIPVWGRLSDRVGRRPVLLWSIAASAAGMAILGFGNSLTWLFVARLWSGVATANIAVAQAYIADVTTPENRAKGMGLIGAAFGLGFTLGPWIGGELAGWSPRMPGFVSAALSISAAAFGYFKLTEPARERRSSSRIFHADQARHALQDARIGIVLLLSFVFIFSWSAFESMFTVFALREFPDIFGVPQAIEHATFDDIIHAAPIVGRYMGFIGIMSAIIQGGLIRRLVPRFGETTLAVAGPAILALSFVVLCVAQSWAVVIVACAIMPIGFGINNPALQGLVSRAYMGMNQSMLSLARLTGPVCAGLVFRAFGPRSPFLMGTAVLVACALLAYTYHVRYAASFPREARGAVEA